jgi:ribosomal protein S18 acetylase RimI-like enzyme
MNLVASGDLAADGVLVARAGGVVCGVTVFAVNAGAAGQMWPPQVRPSFPCQALEDMLVHAAIGYLRAAGSRYIQVLLTDDDLSAIPCLARHGFAHLSALLTLNHTLRPSAALPAAAPPRASLTYHSLAEAGARLLRDVMHRTYKDTLDFPELNGVRTVDDTMEAHRRHGIYHPEQWLVAQERGEPVGVLLLAELADRGDWELSYVGVVPGARGRGLGKELVREALRRAAQLRTRQLTVAVDTRNLPAWNLYAGLGFQPLEEHRVYLLIPPG